MSSIHLFSWFTLAWPLFRLWRSPNSKLLSLKTRGTVSFLSVLFSFCLFVFLYFPPPPSPSQSWGQADCSCSSHGDVIVQKWAQASWVMPIVNACLGNSSASSSSNSPTNIFYILHAHWLLTGIRLEVQTSPFLNIMTLHPTLLFSFRQ